MKRFAKIWNVPSDENYDIFSLPDKKAVWGQPLAGCGPEAVSFHYHEGGIFVFLESGRYGIISESFSSVCHPKTALFIPPRTPHIIQQFGPRPSGWLVSLPPFLCRNLPKIVKRYDSLELLVALGKKIVFWGKSAAPVSIKRYYTYAFINEIAEAKDTGEKILKLPKSKNLVQIAEYLIANPGDMSSIDYWAKHAGMSRRTFTRGFASETGRAFAEWRRLLKVQTAIQRLGAGATVGDISFELGYQNPSAFGKAFKNEYGLSPIEFMKKNTLALSSGQGTT